MYAHCNSNSYHIIVSNSVKQCSLKVFIQDSSNLIKSYICFLHRAMETADAMDDSDEEVDYSKMDQVRSNVTFEIVFKLKLHQNVLCDVPGPTIPLTPQNINCR